MRKLAQRVAVAAGLIMAAGTLQLATSTTAEATPAQCTSYLKSYGYSVGPKVKEACQFAANDWSDEMTGGNEPCIEMLKLLGVRPAHADFACAAH
ncbi:hypothetical protein [Streptomyces roseifaciens]|uniref:hypothetical protein n=1 Tax=Streptomyces roseifaciens TaxID=1488406 RepID=UPI000718097D|nr:hypothetical protein [Streptomyces roseifaciens]